ncbi:hypothetical protein WA1_18140 [Scytonema hofmannii PCC 7110]|uniref:EF-hand domain-containing protein n=1 Tax=Scytonema hofmannii PCC 7110 TaxID=128403 RepID=A0A139XB55_9CYAN|nr:GUN4 domain-containing protein [Scytonema hofmannii]KYC41938.1 hypothetical protein WA1_18140 [Scytonema hofmannii PCC 7110]
MGKFALLIGVSQYESSLFNPLPGVVRDIEAMQRVLKHPEMGDFDNVEQLIDGDALVINQKIEQLFIENRQRNDLTLLYLSGHGFLDKNGYLYYVSRNTHVTSQNKIYTSNAVAARFIQEQCMNLSQSKRQVLILDCCFSGAFVEGMGAKQAIPIIDDKILAQLGGEGRVVLTSSTATQLSYEDREGGFYTRYLIEGIEKGAADADNDGVISVAELHDYAKRKVQEAQPAMKPEIFAFWEGYTIHLAKAPLGDSRLEYRKTVEQCVKDSGFLVQKNCFKKVARRILTNKQKQLRIETEIATAIEEEVLQPFRDYQESLREYEEALAEALEEENILSDVSWQLLKQLQQMLKLQDEDVTPIHERLIPSQQPISSTPQPTLPPTKAITTAEEDDLKSEKGVDYTKLQNLLMAGKWKEADQETYLVMLQAVGRQEGDWIREEELLNFPCTDLRTIDQLWVKYSNGRFGFSVQKRIYLDIGGILNGRYYDERSWNKYCNLVGWKVKGKWIAESEVIYNTSAPDGHLPLWFFWVLFVDDWDVILVSFLALRLVKCKI